jgi:uncharacterized SAM-binding protein YcdF (DUF218 family)
VLFWLGVAAVVFTADRWGPRAFVAAVDAWLLDESPFEADAILVLAGNADARVASAARLYHEGWAPKILLTRVDPAYESDAPLGTAIDPAGIARSTQHQLRLLQRRHGIPAEAIEIVDGPIPITSTYAEALAVREWTRHRSESSRSTGNHALSTRLLVTTDAFHTRRSKWILRHVAEDADLALSIRAVAADVDSGTARLAELRRRRTVAAQQPTPPNASGVDPHPFFVSGYPIFREWSKAAVYVTVY